ncbi:hypothetical protein AX17_004661 [Amanita inopinata Kibby_2008]|nr:hypothetical protein AX17_004661 [Amanita inopinata Kibby_2008]
MDTHELQTLVAHQAYLGYADAASITVLFFDYFLTLDLEVAFIWGSKWSFIKLLYLIVRYMPMTTLSIVLLLDAPGQSVDVCLAVLRFYGVVLTFETGVGEIILTIRTWAICGRKLWQGLGLVGFFICKAMVAFVVLGIWLTTLQYRLVPTSYVTTCVLTNASRMVFGGWLLLATYEAVMCTLLAAQAYSAYSAGGVPELAKVVYRDGSEISVNEKQG